MKASSFVIGSGDLILLRFFQPNLNAEYPTESIVFNLCKGWGVRISMRAAATAVGVGISESSRGFPIDPTGDWQREVSRDG